MTQIDLRPFTAADRDWLVQAHIETYGQAESSDASFGVLVAQILDDFLRDHDPDCERGWIVWEGTTRLGSIFCVRLDADTAKLRLFQLVPQVRGAGWGGCYWRPVQDSRAQGYARMKLWTHKSHAAANTLYLRNGWEIIAQEPVFKYGQHLVERIMQLRL